MTGLYRGEFVKLIERAAIDQAKLKFYITRHGNHRTMSIVDFDLPRREGLVSLTGGNTENDWFQDSFVCNVGVLEHSWVPFYGIENSDTDLYRGAQSAITLLLGKGCIRFTKEIAAFLRNPEAKLQEA